MCNTFFTGDLPTSAMTQGQEAPLFWLRWVDTTALWSGCVDAPDFVPAGSTKGATIDGDTYAVSRYVARTS